MPTIEEVQTQVHDAEAKLLELLKDAQAPLVDYVGKAAEALAERIPSDFPVETPEAVTKLVERIQAETPDSVHKVTDQLGEALDHQVEFLKAFVDTEVAFMKAVAEAAVKPFRGTPAPAPVKKATKAA